MKILILGGAGFIGSHLVDELIKRDHEITVYDNLEPQVHGILNKPPDYLAKNIKFIRDDILNTDSLIQSLKDIEIVYHLAAMVGVGQSMYQIEKYVEINTLGTAKLLDILINKENDVKKLIVASSMSTYGEGGYICDHCNQVNPDLRGIDQLNEGFWEIKCPNCGKILNPIPTNEEKPQNCTSIYALTKKEQEKMCMLIGETYGLDTTALRFFNVYGSRQSLSNPYTGVCAIFSSSLLNQNSPRIYEDGYQSRDFVHVKDVCQALILSMDKNQAKNEVFNVGTGRQITINQVAEVLTKNINSKIKPNITSKYRAGDIRHCFADISKISSKLGYKPKYTFEEGMKELIEWVKVQQGRVIDNSNLADEILIKSGLIK
ncbi:MAG: GDP-mannose 4,6-dehydratase [Promethearchaeota archaeon]